MPTADTVPHFSGGHTPLLGRNRRLALSSIVQHGRGAIPRGDPRFGGEFFQALHGFMLHGFIRFV
jgi:hypothetical protein